MPDTGAVEVEPSAIEPLPEFDLGHYGRLLRRHLVFIVAVVIGVSAISMARYLTAPRYYRATATIQLKPRDPVSSLFSTPVLFNWTPPEYYQTQYKLLQSRGLAEQVVRNLDLSQDKRVVGRGLEVSSAGEDRDAAAIGEIATKILEDLNVEPIEKTHLVELQYVSHYPDLAARIVNGFAEAFIDWNDQQRRRFIRSAAALLSSQIATLKREVAEKQAALQAIRRSSLRSSEGRETSAVAQKRLDVLGADYTTALADRIRKEAAYRELAVATDEVAARQSTTGRLDALRTKLAQLEQRRGELAALFKPDWPELRKTDLLIRQTKEQLKDLIHSEAVQARKAAKAAWDAAKSREETLAAALAKAGRSETAGPANPAETGSLETEIKSRQTLLDELIRRQAETAIAARLVGNRESSIVIVDKALVPRTPFSPSARTAATAGLAGGLLLAIGLVIVRDLADRTVKTREEVERLVGAPVLALIPDLDRRRKRYALGRLRYGYGYGYGDGYGAYGYGAAYGLTAASANASAYFDEEFAPNEAVPGNGSAGATGEAGGESGDGEVDEDAIRLIPHRRPKSTVAEAYRALRTALLYSSASELKLLSIVSAQTSEGKTVTSSNLAIVLAQLGRSVLLIDADLRRPRIHEVFGLSNRRGLVSHLARGVPIEDVIVDVEVPSLFVVPAGPSPPNPSELLASDRMRHLVHDLRRRFDYVVFDTAPILPVTDAIVVGRMCDAVVQCVAAHQVHREEVKHAAARLRAGGVRLVGAVVNRYTLDEMVARGYQYGKKRRRGKGRRAATPTTHTPAAPTT